MPADRDLSSSAVRKLVVLLYLAAGLACVPLSFVQPPTLPGIGPVSDVPSSRENIGRALRDEMELARAPRFSPPGHFYAGTIHVSLSSVLPEAGIYYTLDGSQPAENGMPYTRPLVLEPGEDAGCVVVKAVAVSNGQAGPAVTHSYFLNPDIKNRFKSYVFSLSTDNRNLYDHENGILVPGKRREESEALHPDKEAEAHDANYKGRGRDWERPVYVEAFTPEGARVVAQNAGLRVYGGVTRHYAQKSLRLIARKFYEPGGPKAAYQARSNCPGKRR